jgi:chemosensory pili system protein ChpA (sensor histidine kinase/response regulator)
MAANPKAFDLGPLTWVKTEIDHSLGQARENLDKLAAASADRAPVKYILTHLHQATGALAMVGLGAATRFNEELEKLVAYLEGEDASQVPAAVAAAKKGIAALSAYLDTLLAGEPDFPMRLLAPYLDLNHARGANDANEGDLFFPDLAVAFAPVPAGEKLDDAVLAKALQLQRSIYQQGLLKMLKGGDNSEALRQMQSAVSAIASLQAATPNRPFWSAANAFFDALVFGGLAVGPSTKPIFAKVDQQVKQLIDGSGKVAERLFRDLLLSVARSGAVAASITQLKDAYGLDRLIAVPDAMRGSDDEELATLVRELRELTAQQKDTWLKYTSGNRAALEPFAKQSLMLADRAGRLPNRDIQAVLVRLADVAPGLKARAIPPSEAQALEVATALLFLESALENYFRLGADFARQASTVTERIRAAMAGEALAPMDAIEGGLLDAMTRRAQEKLLVFQVGQEVQVNLQNIEQVLDGYFRDAGRRGELAALAGQFAQVQGALMIMELADAAALNAAVMARVQQFAEGSTDGVGEAAEMVADGLSALGLYITALQQGMATPREVLLPALLRFGLAEPDMTLEPEAQRSTISPVDLDVHKQKVQNLYEDWKESPAEDTRVKLERAVVDLNRDAAVADTQIFRVSGAALQALKDADHPDQTGVFNAIQDLAPTKAPEAPAPQVVQLVDAPGAQVDEELLGIFLEEATEVVATIAASLGATRDAPHDRDALTTIRRGFHTLKGSGRMVGLDDLGEVAWQCEQVMNKWLKDDHPASPQLLGFIDLARESFRGWVHELKESGTARIDGAELTRRAEAIKSGEAFAPAAEPMPVAEAPQPAPAAEPFALEATQPEPQGAAVEAAPAAPAFDFESLDLAPAATERVPEPESVAEPAFDFLSAAAPVASPPLESVAPGFVAEGAALQSDAATELAHEVGAEPTAAEEPDVRIGEVTLPAAFFAIYLDEADQHVQAMQREIGAIEADRMVPVSPDFMRAAHTLASSSRTTGFEPLAECANALEKWLADAIDLPPEFDERRVAVTRAAVDAIAAMVGAIVSHTPPHPRHDVIEGLAQLRSGLREARLTGEGTHIKMPGIPREPEPAAPLADAPTAPVAEAAPVEEPAPVAESAPIDESAPIAEPAAIEAPAPVEAPASIEEPALFAEPVATPEPAPEEHAPVEEHAIPEPAAAEPEAFEAGKDQRRIKDDVDRDLLPIFLDEAREIIPQVSEGVRRWHAAPGNHGPAGELQRHLHTLKGGARMAGLMRLGELAHVLEERVNAADEAQSPPIELFEQIEDRVDRFSAALERLARGEDYLEAEPIEVPVAAVFEHQKDKPAAIAVMAAAAQERAEREALPPEMRDARAALLRVNADLIDRFVNDAGELSIARSRIEGEMGTFKRALGELTENISRMRTQLREIEIASESQMQSTMKAHEEQGETFDPLEFDRFSRMQELTRFLAESLGDVITLHQGLQKNLDEAELAIHAQARLNRELQQGLMGVRLVPLGNLSDRFYRVVRQTAKELDKKANLEIKGTRTELDRSVLEKITGPFEHLLRNAIAHGIEMPAERARAGKPEIGEISLDATQRGNEVVLTIADDGAGLNFPRIRAKAIEAGLLAPDVELPEAQLAQFIFTSGFSTAEVVNQVAGRGVGMDVVKSEITSLGGRVEITSNAGRGTTFTITLPLTLAVTQAVMLRAANTTFAVPSVMIDQVQEYKAQPYAEIVARGEVVWKDNRYPLRSLLPLLGEIDTPTPARQIPVLLLKSGVQRAAIRVDEIVGNREIVVKTIGPQLSRLAGIAGATVLGNGQVVLILNPVQLVHSEAPAFDAPAAAKAPPAAALEADSRSGAPLVMVVDDSLTVRKITGRMLAREGYEVATAKDGVDALQQLQDLKPDCILLDVEMPRMDGFEFARNVRADAATRAIPIIMITSRTADKHRKHALEIGVNEYMGKPYQEEQLLALVRRYTQEAAFA